MLVSTLHVYIRLVVPAHARESPLPGLLMPPKVKFQDGEKVLCYHGPLIYEAKVGGWREFWERTVWAVV